jgi:magnesium-protoporphyrin IX monomethyl ester (oxidative) cyclase
MTKVNLINMPFAEWNRPSFALSQLQALTRREFGESVEVSVHYLNFEFARFFGTDTYDAVAGDLQHLMTGVGEWLFREIAFPGSVENSDEYFQRYYQGQRWHDFRSHILQCRAGLNAFCDELIDRYELDSADVVGFTSMFAQNTPSIAMARLIKERNPSATTVLGGANCEVPMGAVLAEVDVLDAVFSGPALHTFPNFLRGVHEGNHAELHNIPGVLTAQNCRDPRFAKATGRDRDINDFFEPDYTAFVRAFSAHRDDLGADVKPVLLFETSRGCWWGERSHCTFCGLNGLGMNYRALSADRALRQFEWLFQYAPWCEEFSCTDNILPRNYPKDVFANLVAPPNVSLFYEVKLPLSEYDMRTMAQAGVTKVQPGIEALATETLKLMDKGTSVFQNLQFLKNSARHGIDAKWNLLVGFPGEPAHVYEKYVRDIPLLRHLPPPAGAFMVRFDRYSPYFTKAEEYGLTLRPLDFYRLVYPFSTEQLGQLAYFFADQNFAPYLAGAIEWLKPINDQIDEWKALWSRDETRPELSLSRHADGQLWIDDTRSGEHQRFAVGELAYRVLRRLSSPVRESRLAGELDLPDPDLAETMVFLRSHRLVFDEDGRVMSLVMLDKLEESEKTGEPLQGSELAGDVSPGLRRTLPLVS